MPINWEFLLITDIKHAKLITKPQQFLITRNLTLCSFYNRLSITLCVVEFIVLHLINVSQLCLTVYWICHMGPFVENVKASAYVNSTTDLYQKNLSSYLFICEKFQNMQTAHRCFKYRLKNSWVNIAIQVTWQ